MRPWHRTAADRWADLDRALAEGDEVQAMESAEALVDGHWAEDGVVDTLVARCRAEVPLAEVVATCLFDDATPEPVVARIEAVLTELGLEP